MNAMQPYSSMPKILVIDSNMFFVKRLTEALKNDNFEVVHCTHAAYALTMLEWNPPTAILCSTNLRELGAFELPRIVHGDIKTAAIPILAMGDGGDQALMAAFRAGCDDYIDKRLGPENIASHIKTFLRSRNEGFQPTQMLESEDTALEGSLSHLDLPGVIQMLGHSRQSGALHVNAFDLDGIIFFDTGDVLHAEAGDFVGDDAVIHIIKACNGLDQGIYKFVPGDTASTRTVLRSVTELMLEALREVDEQRHGAPEGGF
jgi:DNA-binding response OmpR family regulator